MRLLRCSDTNTQEPRVSREESGLFGDGLDKMPEELPSELHIGGLRSAGEVS